MTVRQLAPRATKSLAESAICFGCALGGLAGFALALQWLIGMLN